MKSEKEANKQKNILDGELRAQSFPGPEAGHWLKRARQLSLSYAWKEAASIRVPEWGEGLEMYRKILVLKVEHEPASPETHS